MATCKECLHYDLCEALEMNGLSRVHPSQCGFYKTAADVVPRSDYEALLHKYELSVAERETNVKGFSEMLHRQRIDLAKEIFKEISKISVPSILPTVKMDWEAFIKLRTRYTMEEL